MKLGWSEQALGNEIGVDGSTISRYENGKGDITASSMAYISQACGFPMREYVEKFDPARIPGDESIPIDKEFKELVGYVSQKEPLDEIKAVDQDFPPRPSLIKDLENRQWVMVEKGQVISHPSYIDDALDWDILNDDENEETQFFRDYMGSEEMGVKRALLRATYKAVQQASMNGDTLKTLTKNALAYIIKDPDRDVHDRLKRYKKFCEMQYKDSEQD